METRSFEEWIQRTQEQPGEAEAKESIYEMHLGPAFGHMALTAIDFPTIAQLRAKLIRGRQERQAHQQHSRGTVGRR